MIKSASQSSLTNDVKYSSMSAGAVPSNEYLIATTVLTGTSSTIVFDNIPQEYRHLKLIGSSLSDNTDMLLRLNSDSTNTNYKKHFLNGSGGNNASLTAGTESVPYTDTGGIATNQVWAIEIDILDYANTNKTTTSRILFTQGDGRISLNSILWNNTAAVSDIRLVNRNHYQHSRFSLYGVTA